MSKKIIEKTRHFYTEIKNKIFSGIATRWLLNIFSPILAVTLLSSIILSVFISNFYNMSVVGTLKTDANSTAKYFESFLYPQYRDFATCAQMLVSDFDKKNMMEIQVSNTSGKIGYSSTGFAINELTITPDVLDARNGIASSWKCVFENTKEKIISVSVPLYNTENRVCGTVRLISSIQNLEKALINVYLIIFSIGFTIIALTAVSGIYFIKSIVIPVRQINEVALEIAEGNLTQTL